MIFFNRDISLIFVGDSLVRQILKHIYLFFLQPGPRDSLIQCYIKRNRSTQTYHLYLSLNQGNQFSFYNTFSIICFVILQLCIDNVLCSPLVMINYVRIHNYLGRLILFVPELSRILSSCLIEHMRYEGVISEGMDCEGITSLIPTS